MEVKTRYIEDLSPWFMYLLLNADNWWTKMRHYVKGVDQVGECYFYYTSTTPLKWSNTSDQVFHSSSTFPIVQECDPQLLSEIVAKATTWFWWEATTLNISVLVPNSSLSCSLLQCYTIFSEKSEFGRAKDLQQIVSIYNKSNTNGWR